ncbi:MAG: hypothetical protein H6717_13405 [Polyangiaceae bacterium]|nr:hypothetical protein [Polyangiaceae bacterium]
MDASLDGGGGAPADAQADAPPGYDASACTAPPPDAGCAVGEYWHACKQSCVSCYDVSLLVFGDVTKVTSLSDSGSGTNQRFPRLAADGSSTRVVLTQGVPPTSPTHTDFLTGVQQGADFASLVTDLGNFVNYPGENESGPLLVPAGAVEPVSGTAAASLFLLMDSDRNGKQQIMSTPLFQGAGSPSVLAAPVNAGGNDYHVAYAHQATPARLFWSSDRAQPGLYTWAVTGGQAQKVAVTLPGGCAASDEDLEPWVTPDGTLLLFSSPRRVGPNCNVPLNGGKRSLYFAYLDPATGLPLADAVELASVRTALEQSLGKTDFALGTPSLDPTACTLYFSSDGDPDDADWDVYRSPR